MQRELQRELTEQIYRAADGLPGALLDFYQTLLSSEVFVPLGELMLKTGLPEVAQGSGVPHLLRKGYCVVQHQGNPTLVIFSRAEFVSVWAEREQDSQPRIFKDLLPLLGSDVWVYLDAAQEVGKEISPWEIEMLRNGPEAIPEIVALLGEEEEVDYTIIPAEQERYQDFKNQLRPILEIYPELKEAYLLLIKDSDESRERPMIGLKYSEIDQAKKDYLRNEIDICSQQVLAVDEQVFIVDDLANETSPNRRLFEEATPFYIAQVASLQSPPGLFSKLLNTLGFGEKKFAR